jgi:hypothetical protein
MRLTQKVDCDTKPPSLILLILKKAGKECNIPVRIDSSNAIFTSSTSFSDIEIQVKKHCILLLNALVARVFNVQSRKRAFQIGR